MDNESKRRIFNKKEQDSFKKDIDEIDKKIEELDRKANQNNELPHIKKETDYENFEFNPKGKITPKEIQNPPKPIPQEIPENYPVYKKLPLKKGVSDYGETQRHHHHLSWPVLTSIIVFITIVLILGIVWINKYSDKDNSVNVNVPENPINNQYTNRFVINNSNPITINIDLTDEIVDAIKEELNIS